MKLKALAGAVGQSVPAVMGLQKKFELPTATEYPDGYAALLQKLLFLSLCRVPLKEVECLLARERKLLELLKVDSLAQGPLWFEALCTMKPGPTRLLLSGYDLGQPLDGAGIQTGLDFADRAAELFSGTEMGDDALLAYRACRDARMAVLTRLQQETPPLADALKWARKLGG